MKKIVFTKNSLEVPDRFYPQPAKNFLPDWYKNTAPYKDNIKTPNLEKDVDRRGTIKKCIPVFDMLTSGYIIQTHVDLWITRENGIPYFTWADTLPQPIRWHPRWQLSTHPVGENYKNVDIPKIISPWCIETPKGYSCLFMPPQHRDNQIIVLSGIVDTDTYNASINFPFVLKDYDFEGLIPAGTPIVQVIPFKRESWKMEQGIEKNLKKAKESINIVTSKFYHGYRNMLWNKKSYD